MSLRDVAVKVGKFEKREVQYTDISKYPPEIRSCGICEHFREPAKCKLVRGFIRAAGGCKIFEPEQFMCKEIEVQK